MPEAPPVEMQPDDWAIVQDILRSHLPDHEVWAFGSRARRSAKRYSDLDLAIISDTPLPLRTQAALAEAFSDSDLPWRVDIVDWATTSATFRAIIEANRVVLQRADKKALQRPSP